MNTEREAFLLRKEGKEEEKMKREWGWGEDGTKEGGKRNKKRRECVRADSGRVGAGSAGRKGPQHPPYRRQ